MRLPGLLLLLSLFLTACGQKGPLFLPEADTPHEKIPLESAEAGEQLNYKERP